MAIPEQLSSENERPPKEGWACNQCEGVRLTTRMATFSYIKALEFPMFQRSWLSAEQTLREATRWVFIGYSLPDADYEFKYLLKRVQASRETEPDFVVITGDDLETTYKAYQKFFGRGIKRDENVFGKGLTEKAITAVFKTSMTVR